MINIFSKREGYEVYLQSSVVFLYASIKNAENKNTKHSHSQYLYKTLCLGIIPGTEVYFENFRCLRKMRKRLENPKHSNSDGLVELKLQKPLSLQKQLQI